MSKALRGRNVRVRGDEWHYRFLANGQQHSGTTGLAGVVSNRKAAEEFAKAKRDEVLRPAAEDKRGKLMSEAAAEFIIWCEDVEYRQKPNTSRRIKTSFASIVNRLGALVVSAVSPAEIEAYKAHRIQQHGVRDVTLRHDLHALSVFYRKFAIKMGWAEKNPVKEVSIPSDVDAVRYHEITAEEEAAYFAVAAKIKDLRGNRNLYDVGKLILHQGCRPEEIMSLKKEHVDLAAGAMRIAGGKTRAARRTLDLTSESKVILAERMKLDGPWLFPSDRVPGGHITKLQYSHDKACREAGVSFTLYDWRHTFGTRVGTEQKEDPFTLAALMGHSNLRTIMRYCHPSREGKKAAMEKYEAALVRRKMRRVK